MAPISLYVPSKVKYPDYKYPIEFIYKASENYQKGFLENMDKIEKAQEKIYDIQALHPTDAAKLKEIKTQVDGIIAKYSSADLSLPHVQHAIESELNGMLKIPEIQTIQRHNKQITEANERRKKLQEKNKYSPISDYNYRKQLEGYKTFSEDSNFDAIIIENYDVKEKLSKIMKDNIPDITSEIQMYETGVNNTAYKVYDAATGTTKYVTKGTKNEVDPVTGIETGKVVSDSYQHIPLPEGMIYIEENKRRTLQESALIIKNHLDANDLNVLDLNLKVIQENNPELYSTMESSAKELDMDILTYYAIYLPAREYEFSQTKISGLTTMDKLKGQTKEKSSTKKETKTKEAAAKDNADKITTDTEVSPANITATYNAYETTSLFINPDTGEMIEDANQYKTNIESFVEKYEQPEYFAKTLFLSLQAQGIPVTMDKKAVSTTFNGILLDKTNFPDLFNPGKRERFKFIDENSDDPRIAKIKERFTTYGSVTDYEKAISILEQKAKELTDKLTNNSSNEDLASIKEKREKIMELIKDIVDKNSKSAEEDIKKRLADLQIQENAYNRQLNSKDIEKIILNINRMGQSYNETLDLIDYFNDLKKESFVKDLNTQDKELFNVLEANKKNINLNYELYLQLTGKDTKNVAPVFNLAQHSNFVSRQEITLLLKDNLSVYFNTLSTIIVQDLASKGITKEIWIDNVLNSYKSNINTTGLGRNISFSDYLDPKKISEFFIKYQEEKLANTQKGSPGTPTSFDYTTEVGIIKKAFQETANGILELASTKMNNNYNTYSTKSLISTMKNEHLMKSYGVVSSLDVKDRSSYVDFVEKEKGDKKTGLGGFTPLQIYEADLANSVRPINAGEIQERLGQTAKGKTSISIQSTITANPSLSLFDIRVANVNGTKIHNTEYAYNQKLDIESINTMLINGNSQGKKQQIVGIEYKGLTFKDGKWYGYGTLLIKDNIGNFGTNVDNINQVDVLFENKTDQALKRTDMTTTVNTLMGTDSKYNVGNFLEYRINTTPDYDPINKVYTYTDTELISGATVTIAKTRNNNNNGLTSQKGDFIYQVKIKDNNTNRLISFAKKDNPYDISNSQYFGDPTEIAESLLPMIEKSFNNSFVNIQIDNAQYQKYNETITNNFIGEGKIFREFETKGSKNTEEAFKAMNSDTSATGYFQIMFNIHKDRIIKEAAKMKENGNPKYKYPDQINRENFRDDKELQQNVYKSLLKDEIIPAVEFFKRNSSKYAYVNTLCDSQLIYLIHREGAKGAARYLSSNGTVYTTDNNTNLTQDLKKIGIKYCGF